MSDEAKLHPVWAAERGRFDRDYRRGELIGRGAYGRVFAAEHRSTRRQVALKIVAVPLPSASSAADVRPGASRAAESPRSASSGSNGSSSASSSSSSPGTLYGLADEHEAWQREVFFLELLQDVHTHTGGFGRSGGPGGPGGWKTTAAGEQKRERRAGAWVVPRLLDSWDTPPIDGTGASLCFLALDRWDTTLWQLGRSQMAAWRRQHPPPGRADTTSDLLLTLDQLQLCVDAVNAVTLAGVVHGDLNLCQVLVRLLCPAAATGDDSSAPGADGGLRPSARRALEMELSICDWGFAGHHAARTVEGRPLVGWSEYWGCPPALDAPTWRAVGACWNAWQLGCALFAWRSVYVLIGERLHLCTRPLLPGAIEQRIAQLCPGYDRDARRLAKERWAHAPRQLALAIAHSGQASLVPLATDELPLPPTRLPAAKPGAKPAAETVLGATLSTCGACSPFRALATPSGLLATPTFASLSGSTPLADAVEHKRLASSSPPRVVSQILAAKPPRVVPALAAHNKDMLAGGLADCRCAICCSQRPSALSAVTTESFSDTAPTPKSPISEIDLYCYETLD